MITAENNLKLGDFGLAKNVAATVGNATERASHRWMAPELLEKGVLSPKYDIFAFAVVLWEMLTGKVPFEGLDWQVIAWKVINEKERLPIPEDCPKAIQGLMTQCWEEDWHTRPSIEEVINLITTTAATARDLRHKTFIAGPWKLEKQIGHQDGSGKLIGARGMVVNPRNGDVAVTCFRGSQVYTSNAKYKCSMDTAQRLEPEETSHPWQVTVNSQGTTYFVTDWSKHIKCYDSSGKFKCHWVSSCLLASSGLSRLYGLAIDHERHLLIGDSNSNHINMHKEDGSYLGTIKVSIPPKYIAVTSQDIIVVADWDKPPQIVSKTGQVMCTLKHPVDESQWNPWGVYCYEEIIIIANQTTYNILCYSDSGRYLGEILISNIFPVGITIAADGKELLVCEPFSVKVFTL
ncbi:uncharacterized protein [Amphiura filiformis]|uniref:uncharacterized protein n=1 Tax=Amphiura filiformis TaxID=82378 RepID=UPI003B21501D